MPSLADRVGVDMSGYERVEQPAHTTNPPEPTKVPGLNVFLRCPIPPVWNTSSDSLRQFYHNGVVPQVRLFNPPDNQSSGGGGTTVVNATSSSSSSSSTTTSTIVVAQTSITTPAVLAGNRYNGAVSLGKAFQLMQVSASSPCRVQLYSTVAARTSDAYRALDVPPPAGTVQGIICDVVLDTSPLIWSFQDRVGSNGDSPTSSTVYLSVTNLDAVTDVITLTFQYVPIVS